MKTRFLSIILCLAMLVITFSGCGISNSEEVAVSQEDEGTQVASEQSAPSTSESKVDAPKGNKKIVIVKELDDEIRNALEQNIISTLGASGYEKGKNAEIIEIAMNGDKQKSDEVVNQIKESKPDIVIINGSLFVPVTVGKKLEGCGIPVVLSSNMENKELGFIDENGMPKSNVTGMYTMLKDMQLNAFALLNRISPASGKKAVFITIPGRFKEEEIRRSLKANNVELKEYIEAQYMEDWQEAVKKYNADTEVAWILAGVLPTDKKDGTKAKSNIEYAKWFIENSKKPSATFWEAAVKIGFLCGLGVDLPSSGKQVGAMAAKILDGEKVSNIKTEYPAKINIVLNKKNADQLGIQIPPDILGTSYRVYIDYEGNYIK